MLIKVSLLLLKLMFLLLLSLRSAYKAPLRVLNEPSLLGLI
jgi:hypothetical protein